jgi:SAM-dependent methyltransferase/ribosomal protein S27E
MSDVFKENDIRPEHLKDDQLAAIEHDIAWLTSRRDQFVDVSCPACGLRSEAKAFEKTQLRYVTCSHCGTLYVTPRPTADMLGDFYAQSKNYAYWNKYIFPASEDTRRDKIFRHRASRLAELYERYCPGAKTLLEVGAGFGTFGEEVGKLGIFEDIIVVEPAPDLAETCRQRGLDVFEETFEDLDIPDGSVDIIASFECLEHLFAPRTFIEKCRRLLRPGGALLVTCPNCHGFDIVTLQNECDVVDHEHLNYFNPNSLSALIQSCGLEVLEVQTPGKLDAELVRKKVLSGIISLKDAPFLEQVLLNRWDELGIPFQQFLAENKLSSHMWVVARLNREDS